METNVKTNPEFTNTVVLTVHPSVSKRIAKSILLGVDFEIIDTVSVEDVELLKIAYKDPKTLFHIGRESEINREVEEIEETISRLNRVDELIKTNAPNNI